MYTILIACLDHGSRLRAAWLPARSGSVPGPRPLLLPRPRHLVSARAMCRCPPAPGFGGPLPSMMPGASSGLVVRDGPLVAIACDAVADGPGFLPRALVSLASTSPLVGFIGPLVSLNVIDLGKQESPTHDGRGCRAISTGNGTTSELDDSVVRCCWDLLAAISQTLSSAEI
jgi:hypothetical protein